MPPQLIYLHIPKSGGTSQRFIFYKLYGKESVFWHGIDPGATGDDYPADSLKSFTVVGGHKPVSYYPKGLDCLYLSVIREPITRVVSLYSYYTQPNFAEEDYVEARKGVYELWRGRGMDSNSLVKSLERCPEFRREVENYQCRYLSRYANTFEGVMKTLRKGNSVIGELESVGAMNSYLSEALNWERVPVLKVNRSLENTHESILGETGVESVLADLVGEDLRLYHYIKDEHGGLYANPPKNLGLIASPHTISTTNANPAEELADGLREELPWKHLQLYSKGYIGLDSNGSGSVGMAIINHGPNRVNSGLYPQMALSYGVYDSSGSQVGNEIAAPPLQKSIEAYGKVIYNLEVQLPPQLLERARVIKVSLTITPSESITRYNPLHVAAAGILFL